MSASDEVIEALRWLLTHKIQEKFEFTRGLLGDGSGNVDVPDRDGFSFVRPDRGSNKIFQMFNKMVQAADGTPILMGELPWQPGLQQVVGIDWDTYMRVGWDTRFAGTAQHGRTHEWRDGVVGEDVFTVYRRMLYPLRAEAAGSGTLGVVVNPYQINDNGTYKTWPGTPGIDLTPARPAGTGTMRDVLVYWDYSGDDTLHGQLSVATGTLSPVSDAIIPARPLEPIGTIPSAYVRLQGGQLEVTDQNIWDARPLFTPITSSITGSSSVDVIENITRTVAASGGDHTTVQAAIDYFREKLALGDDVVTAEAAVYAENLVIDDTVLADGTTLLIQGDTRVWVGMSYVTGMPANEGGLANAGSGTATVSTSGLSTVQVTCTTTNPDFDALGVVAGDRLLIGTSGNGWQVATVTSVLNDVISVSPSVTNDGTSVTLLPNRSIEPASGIAVDIDGIKGLTIQGFYIPTASLNAVRLTNGADVTLSNVVLYPAGNYGVRIRPGCRLTLTDWTVTAVDGAVANYDADNAYLDMGANWSIGGASAGVQAINDSYLLAQGAYVSGAAAEGVLVSYDSAADLDSSYSHNNGTGYFANNRGTIVATSVSTSGNTVDFSFSSGAVIIRDSSVANAGLDPDTNLLFQDDRIDLTAGNVLMISAQETAQDVLSLGDVAGSGDVDINFNNGQMFLRGSDGRLGVGETAPDTPVHIKTAVAQSALTVEGTSTFVGMDFINDTASPVLFFDFKNASGILTRYTHSGGHSEIQVRDVGGEFRIRTNTGAGLSIKLTFTANGNLGINTTNQFGSGVGVVGIANATTVPTTNPSSGHVVYSQAGALKGRGSSGTISTIAAAEPHCPVCGADYVAEFDNEKFGYLVMCLKCLAEEIGERPWINWQPSPNN